MSTARYFKVITDYGKSAKGVVGLACGGLCACLVCLAAEAERQKELDKPATMRDIRRGDVYTTQKMVGQETAMGGWCGYNIFGTAAYPFGMAFGLCCCPCEALRIKAGCYDPDQQTPLLVPFSRSDLDQISF